MGQRLAQQRQEGDSQKRLLAVYDLIGHGYSFDVCIFLVAAELERRKCGYDAIDVAFVAHASDPSSPAAPHVKENNYRHLIYNIMLESSRLLNTVGSVFLFDNRSRFESFLTVASQYDRIFPKNYRKFIEDLQGDTMAALVSYWTREIEAGVAEKPDLFCLYPPDEQVASVRKWLKTKVYPKLPITITLREVEWRPVVNNRIEQWQRFIDSYDAEKYIFIILRDYYKMYESPILRGASVLEYSEPLVSVSLRAALYQECTLNLFVPNGCAVLAMFNNRCKYIYFATQCVGLSMDGCYETNPYQKIVYGSDDFFRLKKTADDLLSEMARNNVDFPSFYYDRSVEDRDMSTQTIFAANNSDRQKYLHLYTPEFIKGKIDFLLTDWLYTKKRIVIYGAGYHTTNLFAIADIGRAEIIGIADREPVTHGELRFGFSVISPEEIALLKPDVILISSNTYQDEIYESLEKYQIDGVELIRLYS